MKKMLTFIPLGVGISAAIIYIFNVLQFRVINNSATLFQILANLRVYLYVSIAGFVVYFFIKLLDSINGNKEVVTEEKAYETDEYEPFEQKEEVIPSKVKEEVKTEENKEYVPNYDYVPVYNKMVDVKEEQNVVIKPVEVEQPVIEEAIKEEPVIAEHKEERKIIIKGNVYCYNCGEKILDTDNYCHYCGAKQERKEKVRNPIIRKIINILEIIILILIIYFAINMLLEYKESKSTNFKSPFKISMTK